MILVDSIRSPVAIAWEKILSKTSKSPASLLSLLEELDDGGYRAVRNMSNIHRAVSNLTTERLDDEVEASFSDIDGEDADGRTPLSWAAFRGDFRCVRKLLLSGVSANIHARDNCIPLHMAARAGSLPCLKILIRHKSRVDHKDSCGNTALHYTCKSGKTALHYTCKSKTYTRKYLRCAECLLASGADIDAEDLTGKTPLRVCIETSNAENALLLLDRGAKMDSCTKDGMTLLMAAVFYNRHEMLRLLIRRGALRDIRVEFTAAAFKAIAQSDAETQNILRMSLNPDIKSLLTYIQEQN